MITAYDVDGMRSALPSMLCLGLALFACTSAPDPASQKQEFGVPSFALVAGQAGIAVVAGGQVDVVDGLVRDEPWSSVAAAGLGRDSAVVLVDDRLAVVGPGRAASVMDCDGCSGVATTAADVVTVRANHTVNEGFDILRFDHHLALTRSVPARRLEERDTGDVPRPENTGSPVLLMVDSSTVVVGYLSRNGGVRRGPSVIAKYDLEGNLIGSALVDGLLGEWSVSPQNKWLAIGVGGTGGACTHNSNPVLVDLEDLSVRVLEPEIPDAAYDARKYQSFSAIDLVWQDDTVMVTGVVDSTWPAEFCDPAPVVWRRVYDPVTGVPIDENRTTWRSVRTSGDNCDDVIKTDDQGLVDATGRRLGEYRDIVLGQAAPAGC